MVKRKASILETPSSTKVSLSSNVNDEKVTWKSLGLVKDLCKTCKKLGWNNPTKIQKESIPYAIKGRDVIGLAETGSGKTASFALPVLQSLLENPQRIFCLVLAPTRELAFQIGTHTRYIYNL